MYTYGITGSSINEFEDVTITGVLDDQILQYNTATGQWENVTASFGAATLNDLTDVTAPAPSTGDLLKWNGSAWVNDDIDLGTDTTGNYVADVTSGTGITVTHTPGEGSSAAVAINAALNDLSDAAVSSASIGQVLEHNGTNFVNRATRPPALNLQTAVTTRKYTATGTMVTAVAGINIGSCAVVSFKNACSVTDLAVYLNATYSGAPTYDYRLGIYADSSGAPGALIVDAGTVSIATGATAGFKTISLASAVSVAANTPVWLVCAATHGPGAVPTLINYVGNLQPYSDYGMSAASHTNAACLSYTTAPATVLPATFALASPETQPAGVAVYATVTVP
jgi:hypothetical protein